MIEKFYFKQNKEKTWKIDGGADGI